MTTESDTAAIRAVFEAVGQGLRDRDAVAVVRNYLPDAVLFDLAPPLSHGVDAAGLAEWIAGWQGPIHCQAQELGTIVSGDLGVWYGHIRVEATTKGGEQAVWWERGTIVFCRTAEGWKIAQEHMSVPFYMDGSLRAAIDLTPGE